jgi:hypothetical protein
MYLGGRFGIIDFYSPNAGGGALVGLQWFLVDQLTFNGQFVLSYHKNSYNTLAAASLEIGLSYHFR